MSKTTDLETQRRVCIWKLKGARILANQARDEGRGREALRYHRREIELTNSLRDIDAALLKLAIGV